ncbi:dipeptidylpeptidase [Coemansia biformis]|uniref:Dipeptidyl-peptidase V n=1 Tax=Coemansia biformis TaxID=1286918 RepID=A0A9W7Y2Y2_9FUNG|nr:dipeptidylpeptidase [Coemansia biformis]
MGRTGAYVDRALRVLADTRVQLAATVVAVSAATAGVIAVRREVVTKRTPISLTPNEESLVREQLARHYAFLGEGGHLLLWSTDGARLYALANDRAGGRVFSVDIASGARTALTGSGYVSSIARAGADMLLAVYSNTTASADIYAVETAGAEAAMRQIANVNHDILDSVRLSPAEDFWFTGARGDQVHGWILRPHGFNASRTYPLALHIHGGPQRASTHSFSHGQWNPNMNAAAGFAVVQINFHGSSGYGQNFTDSIRQKWGGYPYEDLMKGLDAVLANHTFVNGRRLVALGGSYGGYMANWLNGNTDRFSALVSHDGQFDMVSSYYTTDELWFVERLAGKFRTPTLFIHGANDFRLSLEQSLAPWTLLRRRGIPARLVYFADEGHWASRPGNSVRWYREVLE